MGYIEVYCGECENLVVEIDIGISEENLKYICGKCKSNVYWLNCEGCGTGFCLNKIPKECPDCGYGWNISKENIKEKKL